MKPIRFSGSLQRGLRLIVAAAVVLGLLIPAAVMADVETPEDADATDAAMLSVGSGEREVAVYSPYTIPGNSGYLPRAYSNAYDFYNRLRNPTFTQTLFGKQGWCKASGHDCEIWTGNNAWEDDWIDNDNNHVDDVDLVYGYSHGNENGFGMASPDDTWVAATEAVGRWGDKDMEYMFIDACSITKNDESKWHRTMDGMHLFGSFESLSYDVSGFGKYFADRIIWGDRYKDAWFKACDAKEPNGVVAMILAEEKKNYDESAYFTYADPVNNGYYWWWKKTCGAVPEGNLTAAQLDGQFPIFTTPELSTGPGSESERIFNSLAGTFEIEGEVRAASVHIDDGEGTEILIDPDGRELNMDADTGLFYYFDPARPFSATVPSGVTASAIFTAEDAKDTADQFLRENGLMTGDMVYNSVQPVELQEVQAGDGVNAARVMSEETTAYEVIYNRYLTTEVVVAADANGIAQTQMITIPVDGPGAKAKVYVSPVGGEAVVASAASQTGAVIGAQGGWRRVDEVAASATRATLPLLDYESQIVPLFEELEELISYVEVPIADVSEKTILGYTVAGYEEATGEDQDMVYPAYRIHARYEAPGVEVGETTTFTGFTYIPGNPQFMRPIALLESTDDLEKTYAAGELFTATAADASKTLAELGFNSALDFVAGVGPYTYSWYQNEVSPETLIGSGRELSFTVPQTIQGAKDGGNSILLILQITDAGTTHSSLKTSTAALRINTEEYTFLPFVTYR